MPTFATMRRREDEAPKSRCGPPARFLFKDFFLGGVFVFLQGVLAKTGGRRWLFGGEFVVESW